MRPPRAGVSGLVAPDGRRTAGLRRAATAATSPVLLSCGGGTTAPDPEPPSPRPATAALKVAESSLRKITREPGRDLNADGSPDGSNLVFVTDRDGILEIYRADADGSSPVDLTDHQAAEFTPAWSP